MSSAPPLRRLGRRALSAAAALSVLVTAAGAWHSTPAVADAPIATSAVGLSADQASAKAVSTGKDVVADAATTDSSTLTAHPNGTFTLDQSLTAVRKNVGGTWKNLDPTLVKNADGSISTTVTSSDLTLSGGGSGPLATMNSRGRQLSVSLPMSLPAPTLSGSTATYANVLNGVDLKVTADAHGSFSEVLVVKDATAAANPALKTLTLATKTSGVQLSTDTTGNITAKAPNGQAVFAAPAPQMWDSATASSSSSSPSAPAGTLSAQSAPSPSSSPAPVTDPTTGQLVDPNSDQPINSSTTGPGVHAHTAAITAQAGSGDISLTPSASLLTGSSTVYPVYVDPTFTAPSASSPLQASSKVNSYWSTTTFWNPSDSFDVGDQAWQTPYHVSRTFMQLGVPSQLYGANIISSRLYTTENWSASCTATEVQLWATNQINSSTDWDNQPTWASQLDSQTVANGWSSSCPTASVGFNIASKMQQAANGQWSNITLGLRAGNESDPNSWKKFATSVTVSTTYDHAPSTPSGLSTSPATQCTGASTTVGDGDVKLYAPLSDPDGGTLGATFQVKKGSTVIASSNPQNLTVNSGSTAVFDIPKATLEAQAGGAATAFTWQVQATDFNMTSAFAPSTPCSFTFDPTRPGTPTVTLPAANTDGTVGTIGQASTVKFSPPSGTTAPSSYTYQLNGGAPVTVSAAQGGNGVSITPRRRTNVLTVTAVSSGGNYGDTASETFNSDAPATVQADGDLSGDGIADLLTVGGQNSVPAGLWLATGQVGQGHTTGDGHVVGSLSDLGVNGSGFNANGAGGLGSPSDYNGATAVTGQFTGSGLQDVLAYYPSGTHIGVGEVLNGNGDGSPLAVAGASTTAAPMCDTFLVSPCNASGANNPLSLANAGFTSHSTAGGNNSPLPDLIGVSVDSLNGTGADALTLYPSSGLIGSWNRTQLSTATPDGSSWANWTIATTQMPATGGGSNTAMFLWNKSSGELDLWENLAQATDANGNPTLSYTPYKIATGWNTNATLTLQAADINGDGVPDLWSVDASGNTTAYLFSNLTTAGPATVSTVADSLVKDVHDWPLNDATSGATDSTGTQPADDTGSLKLTGTSGATWKSDGPFHGNVSLNGTNGVLDATGPAVSVNSNFTLSVWAKAMAASGVVLSQQGTTTSGFVLYPDATTGEWKFCMETADSSSPGYDCANGPSTAVRYGAWTHLAVTYNATTKRITLYVNGIDATTGTHTPVAGFTGAFHIGDQLLGGTHQSYFNGEVAQAETWNQTLTPTQVASISGTPGYTLFPADSTLYASGSSWGSGVTTMTFNQGQLTVTSAGTPVYTKGTANQPNAVLTLQTDGNLVAYDTAADAKLANGTGALWSSATYGHSNDAMFIQPDGNLVIYDTDGTPLWNTGTNLPGADRWLLTQSSNGADAQASNPVTSTGVTYSADHKNAANSATTFAGTTSSFARTGLPALDTSKSYTVSAWVKLNNLSSTETAVSQANVNHQAFYLGYDQSKNAWYYMNTTSDGTTTSYPEAAGGTATAGTWTHLTAVYDAGAGTMTLYVNGASVATASDTTPVASVGPLNIGGNVLVGGTSSYNQINGSVSDVRVYPAALNATQVSALYNS